MTPCKPRFKGIENFLRRVAFNLGNTPSQTEVKIISCIPIDVTDLQHKILELERELEETAKQAACNTQQPCQLQRPASGLDPQQRRKSVVNTALIDSTRCPARSTHTPTCCSLGGSSQSSSVCERHAPHKSAVAFARSALVSPSSEYYHALYEDPEPEPCNSKCRGVYKKSCMFQDYPQPEPCNSKCLGLLKKAKNKLKEKTKTQLVYYTQPDVSSPFNSHDAEMNRPESRRKSTPEDLSSSYLNDVVQKQFKPERIVPNDSGSSSFSEPVCRDERRYKPNAVVGNCSCCNIEFHDVDNPTTAQALFAEYVNVDRGIQENSIHNAYFNMDNQRIISDNIAYIDNNVDGGFFEAQPNMDGGDQSSYYDSSLYDVIPVRETSQKPSISDKPKETNNRPPKLQSYEASPQNKRRRKVPLKALPHKRDHTKRLLGRKSDRKMTSVVTHSGSIDFGDVYMKPRLKSRCQKAPKLPKQIVVQKQNAGCLTINVNHTECQTASSKSVQLEPVPPEEDRTGETLNQIKSILQTVLTEVKVNAQQRTEAVVVKRDAIVQNGASQGDLAACTNLLNSLSYSPYTSFLGPYTRPVVSSQLPPAISGYANQQKCLQNYPLFIQTTGRQCACCFRSVPSHTNERHAATTATNTDNVPVATRSKETEKLIKEIYKSIALNIGDPSRETSTSEGDDMRSIRSSKIQTMRRRCSLPPAEPRRRFESFTSQVIRTNAEVNTSKRMYSSSRFGSEMISNTANIPRSMVTSHTTTETRMTSSPPRLHAATLTEQSSSDDTPAKYANNTTSDPETEPSSEVDSEATVVEVQKKKKSGLFSKITRLFMGKNKKSKKEEESDEAAGESDSDDYQTVYSERSQQPTTPPPQRRDRLRYRRTHSKISGTRYATQARVDRRLSPYLEQEYRRQWNEGIGFHEGNSPRYTSNEPFERESSMRGRPRPVFYREYDSRPVALQPSTDDNVTNKSSVQHSLANKPIAKNEYIPNVQKGVKRQGLTWIHKGKQQMKQQAACCGRRWKDLILEG